MKLCGLYSAYDHSRSPLKDDDAPLDILPHLAEHKVEMVGVHKATAVSQVRQAVARGFDVFVNLCDGAWDEDRAGIEVVEVLERMNQSFTGAALDFYEPSRENMKRVCRYYGLATPGYHVAATVAKAMTAAEFLAFPLIVKHPSSYSSIGMTRHSRVETPAALALEAERMITRFGTVLIEEFIEGREYTVLVAENADDPRHPVVFDALQYEFPAGETFKHYDLKWVDYRGMRSFRCTDDALNRRLKEASAQFFLGLNGSGYGRCDIRVDAAGTPYLLEINPNCGLFYSAENAGSADLILLDRPNGHREFLSLILKAAERRRHSPAWDLKFRRDSRYGLYASRDLVPGDLIEAFEEQPHVLVSRSHVERHWGDLEKSWFAAYAYPLTEEVWVMWSKRPQDWKPINHSCDPNAWLSGLNVVARRSIACGDEITLDYATFCHETMTPFACACGSADCRRMVTGADSLSPALDRYGEHVSDYVKGRRRTAGQTGHQP